MRNRVSSIAAGLLSGAVFTASAIAQPAPVFTARGHACDSHVRGRPAHGRLVDRPMDRVRAHGSRRRVERAGASADRLRRTCRRWRADVPARRARSRRERSTAHFPSGRLMAAAWRSSARNRGAARGDLGCRTRPDDAGRRSVHRAHLPGASVGPVGQSDRGRRRPSRRSRAPHRVRSVKSTDARIPGDQFFTDERKATLTAIDIASGASTTAHAGAGRPALVPRVADRAAVALCRAGARDARRHREGAERHVRPAD